MRFVRTLAVSIVALSASMALPAPAALAGGATFEFGRRYFAPDQIAVGHTNLSLHGSGSGKLRDGPYYAYLVPIGVPLRPGHIPDVAVPLGVVRMHRLDPSWLVRATIRFRVPDVARGGHEVAICNSPCRDTVVGDLVGGWISVVGSPTEARLRERLDRLAEARERAEDRLGAELWTMERDRKAAARAATGVIAKLRGRIAALEDRIDDARPAATRPEPVPPVSRSSFEGLGWPVAGAFGLFALILLAMVLRTRRRRVEAPRLSDGTIHPDFEPRRRRVRTPTR